MKVGLDGAFTDIQFISPSRPLGKVMSRDRGGSERGVSRDPRSFPSPNVG